jgi:hypothetical protein
VPTGTQISKRSNETLIFGITSPIPKGGQTFVAQMLSRAMRSMNIGPTEGVPVYNMSDWLVEQLLVEQPDLTADKVEFLKDAPGSGIRQRLSEISQYVRRDDPAAIAEEGFGRMGDWGIMTAIKFIPETGRLIQRVRESGGGLLVVETPKDIWLQRLKERGLHIPAGNDAVEMERPPSELVIETCEQANIPVWKMDNSRELKVSVNNPYYRELMKVIVEAQTKSRHVLTVN